MKVNTYRYASSKLKDIIDSAKFFLERGGSFKLLNKKMQNKREIVLKAAQINPKNYQHFGRKLEDL